jgi:hypothetical protein
VTSHSPVSFEHLLHLVDFLVTDSAAGELQENVFQRGAAQADGE